MVRGLLVVIAALGCSEAPDKVIVPPCGLTFDEDGGGSCLTLAAPTDGSADGSDGVEASDGAAGDTVGPAPGSCPANASLGCVTFYSSKVCNAKGTAFVEVPCGTGELCLGQDGCTPATCIPGTRECTGLYRVGECVADGTKYETVEQCGPGLTCDNELNECVSTCSGGQKPTTNVGCVYALVDLGNFESEAVNAATDKPVLVVVSNVSQSADAHLSFLSRETGEALPFTAAELIVPKFDLRTYTLPTGQAQLKTSLNKGSWLLTSDQPISVTLINPQNGLDVRSNDASLLFPTGALGKTYFIMGWKSFWTDAQGYEPDGFPKYGFTSYITVVATSSGKTTVQITPATDVRAGVGLDGAVIDRVPSGQTRTHVLNEGEVLNYAVEPRLGEGDLTGSYVESDKSIAVFSAHNCAFIPDIQTPFCDHLGHQLTPTDTWGNEYINDLFAPRSPSGYFDVFRVMAQRDGTKVECEPAIAGCAHPNLKRGEWFQYNASQSHRLKANNPIEVGHFMTGSNYDGHIETCGESVKTGVGDPAFTIAAATDQYINAYVFLTPPGYKEDWVNVTHKIGAVVTLDGAALGAPQETLTTAGYAVTRVQIQDGVHSISSAEPFGIIAYGYDCDVSYAYPGGMLLQKE